MKMVVAIIQPVKFEAVKEALAKAEIYRMTVSDVQGYGRQKGHTETYRGHEYTVNLLHKVKVEIAVEDGDVGKTVSAIVEAARTGKEGKIGDGKLFILPLEDVVRIRTGEHGPEAL
ncbi:MAG: P-II family nitrogen regulator [Planctomycetes bacterium]|nr:P-II family nitrogen regulator [Planctomycetota bacterium]